MTKRPSLQATIAILLSFMTTLIDHSSSVRTLGNIPTHNLNHNHSHRHKITFLMRDVLSNTTTQPSPKLSTTNDFPFSKPRGIFPPVKGIPVPQYSTDQTLDLSSFGFSFPTKATLEELEFREITLIDQELLEEVDDNLKMLGKAQGVYVASSEDGSSHMMAMTAKFAKDEGEDDGLRLFGMHRSDVFESHVTVIGGTGKYEGANGYAAVKVVDRIGFSKQEKGKVASTRLLLFDVYLS